MPHLMQYTIKNKVLHISTIVKYRNVQKTRAKKNNNICSFYQEVLIISEN
jgi:hypothetical protein